MAAARKSAPSGMDPLTKAKTQGAPPGADTFDDDSDGYNEVDLNSTIAGFWAPKEGTVLFGTLRGMKDKPSKMNPGETERTFWATLTAHADVMSLDEESGKREAKVAEPGDVIGINGTAKLRMAFDPLLPMLKTHQVSFKMIYDGKDQIPNSMKTMHAYRVKTKVTPLASAAGMHGEDIPF